MLYTDVNTIKDLRKIYSFNQAQMAYLLGCSVRSYRDKEKGLTSFSQYEIIKMILVFELEDQDVIKIFFSERNNQYLYTSTNLNNFKRNEYLKDIQNFYQSKENDALFRPWKKYNIKKENMKRVNSK